MAPRERFQFYLPVWLVSRYGQYAYVEFADWQKYQMK
jgi:hypothetical protein